MFVCYLRQFWLEFPCVLVRMYSKSMNWTLDSTFGGNFFFFLLLTLIFTLDVKRKSNIANKWTAKRNNDRELNLWDAEKMLNCICERTIMWCSQTKLTSTYIDRNFVRKKVTTTAINCVCLPRLLLRAIAYSVCVYMCRISVSSETVSMFLHCSSSKNKYSTRDT